jgi:hypothetical protein
MAFFMVLYEYVNASYKYVFWGWQRLFYDQQLDGSWQKES